MTRRLQVACLLLLGILLLPTLIQSALAGFDVQEMSLNPTGAAYEIYADSQGDLWISDYGAGEIWRVNAAGTGYTAYSVGGNPSDTSPDNQGGIWWVDGTSINQLEIATANTQTWTVTGSGWLYGLSIDSQGRVWIADSEVDFSNVYRFNPANRELCTFTLPDEGQGYYPAAVGEQAWLGDTVNGRLLRFDSAQITWWDLPIGSFPKDVDVDDSGNVWYVDLNLSSLGRLVPGTNELTVFTLPAGQSPASLTTNAGKVWYTELMQPSAGVLDPSKATGSTHTAITSSVSVTPSCRTLAKAATGTATTRNGIPTWSTASYSTLVGANGWSISQLPPNSLPWGIAVTDYGWMVDSGRRVLAKLSLTTLSIQADKTPNVSSVPETGGEVTFTFKVTNTSSPDAVTITSLSDSAFGALAGDANCQVGTSLPAGAFCSFAITRWVEGDFSGAGHSNTFTVHAEDPDQIDVQATADAAVAFTNVPPSIEVTKTASATSVVETGEEVTFTFQITNPGAEPATITGLTDSVFGTLAGDADCKVDTVLAAGASCQFSIIRFVSGSASGPAHHNTFTALVKDNENSSASASDDATVTFTSEQASWYVYLPLLIK